MVNFLHVRYVSIVSGDWSVVAHEREKRLLRCCFLPLPDAAHFCKVCPMPMMGAAWGDIVAYHQEQRKETVMQEENLIRD